MTIKGNKAQGQTLAVAGLDLHEPPFSHGQLYVGIPRVASKHGLTFLVKEGKRKHSVPGSAVDKMVIFRFAAGIHGQHHL